MPETPTESQIRNVWSVLRPDNPHGTDRLFAAVRAEALRNHHCTCIPHDTVTSTSPAVTP